MSKYYYSGILLPELPQSALQTNPYCLIRENNETGHYDLLMATGLWSAADADTLNHADENPVIRYRIDKATAADATEWIYYEDTISDAWGDDANRIIRWSNKNIFYTTTEGLHLAASTATPEENDSMQIEYIKSTGYAYIDTGVMPNTTTQAEVTYLTEECIMYGAHILSAPYWYLPFARTYNSSPHFLGSNCGEELIVTSNSAIGNIHTVKAYPNGSILIDGQVVGTNNPGSNIPTMNLHLLAYSGAPTDVNYKGICRIYRCKIWDNGVLIRDFIPYNQRGIVGLLDIINNSFYSSLGTSYFMEGPNIEGSTNKLYNGVFLPEIPQSLLEEYPYVWIRQHNTNSEYQAIFSKVGFYYENGGTFVDINNELNPKYICNFSDGAEWVEAEDSFGYYRWTCDADRFCLWTNHNIPKDSGSGTTFYTYETEPIRTVQEQEKIYSHTIDFSDSDWATRRTDVFSVSPGSIPFYVNSTFTYNDKPTFRSGVISDGGSTETTINFNLITSGTINLNYSISSEGNYDKLHIYIDNVEVVTSSGTVTWTTYGKNLNEGNHTLRLQYTKDGSASTGSDACAIGYITFTGVMKDYDRKYLLRSGTTIYTISDGELLSLEEAEINFALFQTYGLDEQPDDSFLLQLVDPEILFWQDSTEYGVPKFKIDVIGVPPVPQTIITNTQDMSDSTILGIEGIQAVCSDDILFALSFDDEATWKAYDGTTWITLDLPNTGMTKTTMESIGLEAWAEVVTSDYYKIRFILPTTTSYMTSLVVNYIN